MRALLLLLLVPPPLLMLVSANGYSPQFINDWRDGNVAPPACPDDFGPPGSFGLGDLVCSLLACKRTPGWIATRPCNTHLIGGTATNGTCFYSALGANGTTTQTACGSDPTFQGGRACICKLAAAVPCQCTYAQRLNDSCARDAFGECSTFNSAVLAFRACDSPYQPNATYTQPPATGNGYPPHSGPATTTTGKFVFAARFCFIV